MRFNKTKQDNSQYKWNYKVPKINQGKQTLNDMSLIVGFYDNYLVTKTGSLVGHLIVSGINLDLLNDIEQEDVFNDYNAFLMSTIGNGIKEEHQYSDTTIPVNMTNYIVNQKKKYIEEMELENTNNFKKELIASYIDHWTKVQQKKAMTTKKHILTVKVKLHDKTEESLLQAVQDLTEKLNQTKKDLEDSLSDFDIQAQILPVQEIEMILKNLINFKGKG
ncbi:TrsD/TraD family conjugative transfer protein [Streptococcus parauberis]|uniref:TrsD/TraD family conjugative transfer protein n=1 Tax=Streptococcus parauberis TaxID=1348 RepID=UPI0039AFCBA1